MNICVGAFLKKKKNYCEKFQHAKRIQDKWTRHWASTIINSRPIFSYNLHVCLTKTLKEPIFECSYIFHWLHLQKNPYHSSLHKADFPKGHIQIKWQDYFQKNQLLIVCTNQQNSDKDIPTWQDNSEHFACTLRLPFPYLRVQWAWIKWWRIHVLKKSITGEVSWTNHLGSWA